MPNLLPLLLRPRAAAAAAALAALLVGTGAVHAEPVPPNERIPVDIRRTTFVVRDIDKSLPLYRDALGLKVIYDQKIGQNIRLVLMRANDTFIGALGLMQRLNASGPVPEVRHEKAGPGQMIMVINVADLEQRWARIEATPHIKVDTKPVRVEYPNPAGGVIPVLFSAVWDADGNYIELNKLLGAPAGAAPAAPTPPTSPTSPTTPSPATPTPRP